MRVMLLALAVLLAVAGATGTPEAQPSAAEAITLGTPARVRSFIIARNGRLAAAICEDQKLRLWALPQASLTRTIDLSGKDQDLAAVSDEGNYISTADRDNTFTVWDTTKGSPQFQIQLPHGVSAAEFSHDSKLLALAASGEPVQTFDVGTGRKLYDLEPVVGGSTAVAFSRDDTLIATADADTAIRIYYAQGGRLISRNTSFLLEPFTLDFTSDGKQVVAGGADKVVLFIEAATGKVVRRMQKAADPVVYVGVSPDGRSLVTGFMNADNMGQRLPLIIWDVASCEKKVNWVPPARPIGGAWTPNGELLVATSSANGVRLWRVQ